MRPTRGTIARASTRLRPPALDRLKSELRVEKADQSLLWITTLKE
jgi:hypothetical protein